MSIVDKCLKSIFGERYRPDDPPQEMDFSLIPCCEEPTIKGNRGDLLGFSLIRCSNCGTQIGGRNIAEAVNNWNFKLAKAQGAKV